MMNVFIRSSAIQACAERGFVRASSAVSFHHKALSSAACVATAAFVAVFAGSTEALSDSLLQSPQLQTTFSAYAGVRGQIWDVAQNCFSYAKAQKTFDKWDNKSDCFVPATSTSSHYDEHYILNWDSKKNQVLLIPVDYISGVEANNFFDNPPSNPAALLPDY